MLRNKTPLKCIKEYCLQCGDGTYKEVNACEITDCPLWKYRFGTKLELHEKKVEHQKQKQVKKRGSKSSNV